MGDADSEIAALRQSIERLTAQVDRLATLMETASQTTESRLESQFRDLIDRPDVEYDDRNTPTDILDTDEDDDAARV